ncbi:hypothetical protein GCK72_019826 [Caenorhabditis remanei]|uniref:C-type lectin domain-containing protein n=1 Tax=Caenorhabditis remanei TaxID=31234 RepID=A0A6A5GDX0_CAERE|nr:hypothetical protein GCK72_019826 [Caenorhabditis remanei]KAF1753270.1 hypothetical protein GCK72_019826 [Caenorhabditis remanei]
MTYVCELPPTVHDSTCDFNYNSHCYSPFPYRKYVTDAQNFCVSRCSNLVSIHSANENRFIQSMYPDVPYMYTMIGALATSLDYIIWIDGSESDYNNMRQTTESPRGSCVAMATGSVDTGYWFVFPAIPSTVSTLKQFPTSLNLSSSAVYSTTPDPRVPICTNNFTMVDGKCWKLFNHGEIRSDADKICKTYSGSTLVSIKNYDENKLLIDFVKDSHIDTLWTGLFCNNGTNSKSCFWDVQAGSAGQYSNFGTGYPNPNYGGCVYFTASGNTTGQWGSAQCSQNMPFVCELPPTIIESGCKYIYNNNCYIRTDYGYTTTQAQRYCVSNCANLVSIHSGNENRFIQAMYDMSYAYILIGGLAPSRDYLIWLDGSPTDYNNLNVINPGVCVLMSLSNGSPATWYTKECGYPSWFLCKRPVGAKC